MTMTSSRPYLIRALYEWILENDCTPYILVNAMEAGVSVPQEHVKDGQIVLNISPSAVKDLMLHNDSVEFQGRFAGVSKMIHVPVHAVLGIYARENGQGMVFDADGVQPPSGPDGSGPGDRRQRKRSQPRKPALRVVK